VWAAAIVSAGIGVYLWIAGLELLSFLALGVLGVPSLLALVVIPVWDGPVSRTGLLWVWSLGAGAAVILSGGLSGPFAVLSLLPLAIAALFNRSRLMPMAAGLSLMIVGLASLAQLSGVQVPLLSDLAQFWFSVLALVSLALGLATALMLPHGSSIAPQPHLDSLERLEQDLAAQPHLILTLDTQGRALSAYGSVPQGISLDALFDQGLVGIAAPVDQAALASAFEAALSQGWGQAGFIPLQAEQAHSVIVLHRQDSGTLSAILRDATADHSREARLVAAKIEADEMNEGKSRFLANMSHELRTPLNAIMGFSDMMRTQMFGPLTGKYAEYVELIHESGRHLLDLINDVLDMSKIQAQRYELTREIFDIREPVNAALRLLRVQADEAGVKLRGILPLSQIEAHADRRAVKQIVINLVSNAIKFTPSGGLISVSVQASGAVLDLTVIDNGIGISAQDLTRLGRPFEQVGDTTRQIGGTGLGLSLVRAFAELHGGEMIIESRLGEGTAVTVRLPVLDLAELSPSEPDGVENSQANIVAFPGARMS
jgi:two-component system, cell cycle sensor histidine kinase DivJ